VASRLVRDPLPSRVILAWTAVEKFMKKKFKIIISCLALFFSLFLVNAVLAGDYGLTDTANKAELLSTNTPLAERVGQIIGVGLSLIGVAFFILMIYGGFIWMFARGNEQEVTKAKDIIISATIGLVIVLSAYAITRFIGDNI
jgi:TRAP-type C4-dicarboxylate transport system permease small subunit